MVSADARERLQYRCIEDFKLLTLLKTSSGDKLRIRQIEDTDYCLIGCGERLVYDFEKVAVL